VGVAGGVPCCRRPRTSPQSDNCRERNDSLAPLAHVKIAGRRAYAGQRDGARRSFGGMRVRWYAAWAMTLALLLLASSPTPGQVPLVVAVAVLAALAFVLLTTRIAIPAFAPALVPCPRHGECQLRSRQCDPNAAGHTRPRAPGLR
jgi:hypothetical protein